jgi:Thiamine biosynthesis enzyme ThiH and related uncharacterized enzymes
MPGGGGEILDDEIRTDISPLKCNSSDWLMVHREAHKLGLKTTGTMMIGVGEKIRHRINHLERLRVQQDETKGFTLSFPGLFRTNIPNSASETFRRSPRRNISDAGSEPDLPR